MATVEQTCKDLGARLQEVQLDKNTAETNYSIEKQWRIALQVCPYVGVFHIYTMCDLYSIYGVCLLFTVRNGHLLEFDLNVGSRKKMMKNGFINKWI